MPSPDNDDFGPWSKITPSDGRVVFNDLVSEKDYRVEISHPDYVDSDAQLTLDPSGRQPIYYLTPIDESDKFRLTVLIVDTNGDPIEDVSVSVGGSIKQTDSDGSTHFDLEPGTYDVEIRHEGYQDTIQTITIEETDSSETFSLESGGEVGPSGSVVLRTDATVTAGESIDLTIYEDVDNTGAPNNSREVSVPDGAGGWELDTFDASEGNSYYARAVFSSDSWEQTPQLHSVETEITTSDPIGMAYGRRQDGTLLDIPVFDPADLDDARFQARLPDGTIGAFGLVGESESALQCRTPDGVVHGVVVGEQ